MSRQSFLDRAGHDKKLCRPQQSWACERLAPATARTGADNLAGSALSQQTCPVAKKKKKKDPWERGHHNHDKAPSFDVDMRAT